MMTPPDPRWRHADAPDSASGGVATLAPEACTDTQQVDHRPGDPASGVSFGAFLLYGLLGAAFGLVLVQSQVISWFRIVEMFRFESFHMYGVIGSAVATAALGVWVIQKLGLTTASGEPIRIAPKAWGDSRVPGARYWMGGTVFGLGWALLGACPGPLLALLGGGVSVMLVALAAALAGTWSYALLRDRLPH